MKEIPLTQGCVALVDDEDYQLLNSFTWFTHRTRSSNYARNNAYNDGTRIHQYMHRIVLGIKDAAIHVDHVNGNGLDNRRQNLRMASQFENARNRQLNRNNTSGFKGVFRGSRGWRVQLRHNGTRIWGGCYGTAIEAAEAYNKLALQYHGEFACLNQIPVNVE